MIFAINTFGFKPILPRILKMVLFLLIVDILACGIFCFICSYQMNKQICKAESLLKYAESNKIDFPDSQWIVMDSVFHVISRQVKACSIIISSRDQYRFEGIHQKYLVLSSGHLLKEVEKLLCALNLKYFKKK
jgi:hypothetical protein